MLTATAMSFFETEIERAVVLALGSVLVAIGVLRILVWQKLFHLYSASYMKVALTVGGSLIGVVLWGTLIGSMLPFLLKRFGFDPARRRRRWSPRSST